MGVHEQQVNKISDHEVGRFPSSKYSSVLEDAPSTRPWRSVYAVCPVQETE